MANQKSAPNPATIKLSPKISKALKRQREAFRTKFGRDPLPDDPVFFDPEADEPTARVSLVDEVVDALNAAGLPAAELYAFRRTGRLGIGSDMATWSADAIAEWDAAVSEFKSAPADVADTAHRLGFSIERATAWGHSHKHCAFTGSVELDLEFVLLGERVTRRVRYEYGYTPEWEYYDLVLGKLFVGWGPSWRLGTSLYTQPEDEEEAAELGAASEPDAPRDADDEDDPDPPAWAPFSDLLRVGVLPYRVQDKIDELIDQKCRAEDIERRRAAGLVA